MPDASEESDHFDGIVQEQDDTDGRSDASDSHSDQGDDSDSDGGRNVISNDLLDMSAEEGDESEESDDDSDGSNSDDSMDGYLNRMERSESPELHFFPQFKRLPIELRYRIWELFCPEILDDGRVYPFLPYVTEAGPQVPTLLCPGVHLDQMTASSRAVLAVHKESRHFALRAFPDELHFREGFLRFNKEKDIILIDGSQDIELYTLDRSTMNQIRNIGFGSHYVCVSHPLLHTEIGRLVSFLAFWEDPGTIYLHFEAREEVEMGSFGKGLFDWCVQDEHRHYEADVYEEDWGMDEELGFHYVWPNLDKHPRFLESMIETTSAATGLNYQQWVDSLTDEPIGPLPIGFTSGVAASEMLAKLVAILQPMVQFTYPDDYDLWDMLERRVARRIGSDGASEQEDDDESDDLNEYESSGIDDSDIEEDSEDSADEGDDLIVIDSDGSGDEDSDGGASTFAGFSPLQEHGNSPVETRPPGGMIDLTQDEDGARFSSPEPDDDDESQTIRGSDSSGEDVHQTRPRARGSRSRSRIVESEDEDGAIEIPAQDQFQRANKRKRVLDSDDDDEVIEVEDDDAPQARKRKRVIDTDDDEEVIEVDDDDAPRKRGRTVRHRRDSALIVIPGDDSAEETRKMRENVRRARAIIIDDDDDDDEDEDERVEHRAQTLSSEEESESESDSEEDEEEDEEEETTRPLTLMERLELHRRNNPLPGESDDERDGNDDPDIEEMGEDDYDARNYGDFEDDDERMGPSDDDAPDAEDGVDYGEEEDEEDEDEGGYY